MSNFYRDNNFYFEVLIRVPNEHGCDSFSLIDDEENQIKTLEFLQSIDDKQKLLDVLHSVASPAID